MQELLDALNAEQSMRIQMLREQCAKRNRGQRHVLRHRLYACWAAQAPEAMLLQITGLTVEEIRDLIVEEIREDALFDEEMRRTV